jgi:hypothetical protein
MTRLVTDWKSEQSQLAVATVPRTHPHQWQGLTDDEIDEIYANTEPDSKMDTYYIVLSRAIEQALKEKNHV